MRDRQVRSLKAFSKVNLLLNVKDRLANGYHNLESVVIPTPIFDIVKVALNDTKEIVVNYSHGKTYENDNVYRIAKKIQEEYDTPGFIIDIEKNIPDGIGLGGSSADAGVAARAISDILQIEIKMRLLVSIGSDVPYMYYGGSKIIEGIGDKLTFIDLKPRYVCLLYGDFSSSTELVYKKYDEIGGANLSLEDFIAHSILSNALQDSAIIVQPRISKLLNLLNDASFRNFAVTGSGSAVIATEFDKDIFINSYRYLKTLVKGTDYKLLAYFYQNEEKFEIIDKL